MLFNSLPFILFFAVVTLSYFLIPHRYRWALLLGASCFFYMFFKPVYILILAFTIVIDYYAGILLENETNAARKKRYLIMSLVANIGVLAVFKYYNFINSNVSGLALVFGYKNPMPFLKIALPIGLSFHTFQAMSYTIEVYRSHQKAERHFGIYALYVMFYPQLVAGPIERPQNMLHQFHEKKYFNYDNAVSGLRLMMWGLFKKAVIADRLATVTDPVFNDVHQQSGVALFIGCIFFSFQIYCDFSGYSDIALGSARVMGFKLMRNFDRPYAAKSIAEFWRRWHISLSTWFRDYVYIPLGGNKVSRGRQLTNLFLVFLISGLWHGANWTFIIWGALHGLFMIMGNFTAPLRAKLSNVLQQLITFLLVTGAWVFFRANTVGDAMYVFRKLPTAIKEFAGMLQHKMTAELPVTNAKLMLCFAAILVLEVVQAIQKRTTITTLLARQPRYLRWMIYYAVLFAIAYLGVFNNKQFIYFQF